MKRIILCAPALALSLSACATTGLETKAANTSGGVEAYKLFTDTCDRDYATPFSAIIHCTARYKLDAQIAAAKAQAEQNAKLVKDAVTEALKGVKEAVVEALKANAAPPVPTPAAAARPASH